MVQHRVALATLWSLEGTMWCLGGKGSAYIPVHLSGILNINITKKMQEKKKEGSDEGGGGRGGWENFSIGWF